MATSPNKGKTTNRTTSTAKRSTGTKKTTAKKGTASARTKTASARSKSAKAAAAKAQKQAASRQVGAIVLFAVSFFLLALALIPGGNAWAAMQGFFFGLFGACFFLWPFILLYVAIMTSLNKEGINLRAKILDATIIIVLLCALFHIFGYDGNLDNYGESISAAFAIKTANLGGGAIGAIVGGGLYLLFGGKAAAAITDIILLFVCIMVMSGTTLMNFFKGLWTPVQKASDATSEHFEERSRANEERRQIMAEKRLKKQQQDHSRFNPDVALGPEFGAEEDLFSDEPASPVTSRRKRTAKTENKAEEKKEPAAPAPALKIDDIIKKAAKSNPISTEEQTALDAAAAGLVATAEAEKKAKTIANQAAAITTEAEAAAAASSQKTLQQYRRPPTSVLKAPSLTGGGASETELRENAEKLVNVLDSFGVSTTLVDIARGPSVTRYELAPAVGVKISKITGLADDIALNMAASGVRIEAPIPGKAAVGIEIPNKKRETVTLREVIESPVYKRGANKSLLNVALGRDISGNVCVTDLSKMPHLLLAGTTGSGKSVCLNAMILSILFNATPDEVKLIMIDPKKVEFSVYNGIPHLLIPVVSDPHKAAGALSWAVKEMLNRYKSFSEHNVRDINGYNELAAMEEDLPTMPRIVIFIDELADLMMATPKEVEDSICRLAQMARAAGMHLVIATQRPSVDVITGLIKANIPSRLSLSVSSAIDSRTILDTGGAEKLLGNGDLLFNPIGNSKPTRIQGCFTSDHEVEDVVNYIKKQSTTEYSEDIIAEIEKEAQAAENANKKGGGTDAPSGGGSEEGDELLPNAIQVVVEAGSASTTLIQRKLKVGYARAARIIDELEERGVIGPYEGSKPRKVLMTKNQWLERNAMSGDEDDGSAAAIDMGLEES